MRRNVTRSLRDLTVGVSKQLRVWKNSFVSNWSKRHKFAMSVTELEESKAQPNCNPGVVLTL